MAPSTRILNPITWMVGSNLEPYLHITQSVQSDHGSKYSDPESNHSDGRMAPSTQILNSIIQMVGSNLEPYLHITQSVQSDHGSKHSDPESNHLDGQTQSDYSDPQSDHLERPQGVRSSKASTGSC